MRIALSAFAILAAVACYWLTYADPALFQLMLRQKDPAAVKDALLVLIAAWMLAEAIFLRGRERSWQESADSVAAAGARRNEAEAQSAAQVKHLEELASRQAAELEALGQERDRLRNSVTALEGRIAEAEALATGRQRPEAIDAEIVNFLGLLQEKGRFIDFLMDDVAAYDDQQVGAAARVVHQGCAAVLKEYFQVEPVFSGSEGGNVVLEEGFDARKYRLVGRVSGKPPFNGVVLHRGWKTSAVTLPRVTVADGSAERIISPTEVELR